MEAAAKTVELLTQRTLPDTPYYLSNSPDWRYRPRPDDHSRPEEWHSTRLQYSTLLAEADRGVLLTRPDYDMREEPPKPVSRDISSLSKSGGEKKKLSLSDYKNKKTAPTSASPPEPSIARLKESERAGASASASSSPAGSGTRPSSDHRINSESRKSLDGRPSDGRKPRPDTAADAKPRSRDYIADMSLPPKPPAKNYPLPPRPPSPSSKKRVADHEDDARPQKRSRPENTRPNDERPSHRDDPVRRRDPSLHGSNHKESPLLNGKSSLKSSSASGNSASPATRHRGESTNGSRSSVGGKSAPIKQESPSKPVVPPLLSPLRLSFEEDSPPKHEKHERRRSDGTPPPRSKKPDSHGEEKKRKARPLPPLLSPTLPPVIEAALRRRKQQGSPEPDERPKDRKDAVSKQKKSYYSDDSEDEPPRKPSRRLIVNLRIPKRLRKSVHRILAMPPGRDSSRHDHERSTDEERHQARKRPFVAPEAGSVSMKKSRSSDMVSSSRGPTTPPRKGNTAMSRVNSNNSTANTPGEQMNRTPSLTGSSDKRPNGAPPAKLDADGLLEKEGRMRKVGIRLKHGADNAIQGPQKDKDKDKDNVKDRGREREKEKDDDSPPLNPKLGIMLGIESMLCFMHSFHAGSTLRLMHGKKTHDIGWSSLYPLSEFILKALRGRPPQFLPPHALVLLLQVFTADEIIKSKLAEEPSSSTAMEVCKYETKRGRTLTLIREITAGIENPRLRADMTPWSTLDEVTDMTLRVMRRWCNEENVDWSPVLSPRDYGR